jgi:poly-gamma-glutamate synthase PgsB/CapB
MRTLLPCLILFLLYLAWERIALRRARRRIPLVIAVTGTRGKSSVTRLLASVLTEAGRKVLAKTTGSQAMILLPGGGQIELDRSITPSILEQKQLIHRAARLGADCLVAEVMSIRPENHFVESRLLLQPDLIAITNVRRDHTEIMGETEEQIASVLALDICPRSTVFLPAAEDRVSFRAEVQRCGAELASVAAGFSTPLLQEKADELEFSDNLDLVCTVANRLGLAQQDLVEGIRKARHDIGRMNMWRYRRRDPERTCYLVNAFAANDPESTFQVLEKAARIAPAAAGSIIGVFNLRADRLPRTLQWISVLKDGGMDRFSKLFLVGAHSGAVRRRLPQARALKNGTAEQLTGTICAETADLAIIFGFGNFKGAGRMLADYWSSIGEPME